MMLMTMTMVKPGIVMVLFCKHGGDADDEKTIMCLGLADAQGRAIACVMDMVVVLVLSNMVLRAIVLMMMMLMVGNGCEGVGRVTVMVLCVRSLHKM